MCHLYFMLSSNKQVFSRTPLKNCDSWLGNQNIFISALHFSDLSSRCFLTSNLNSRYQTNEKIHFLKSSQALKEIIKLILEPTFFNVSQGMWFWYLEITELLFCNTENLPQCQYNIGLSRWWFQFHISGLNVFCLCWSWSYILHIYTIINPSIFVISWLQSQLIRVREKKVQLRILELQLSQWGLKSMCSPSYSFVFAAP